MSDEPRDPVSLADTRAEEPKAAEVVEGLREEDEADPAGGRVAARALEREQGSGAGPREARPRLRAGERTVAAIGHRRWGRPNVAVSGRIFRAYGLKDPWDPASEPDKDPIPLGPVSLRLGQQRRQPAPHLKPRMPKPKQQPGQAADPLAKWRRPKVPSASSDSSGPPKGPPRPPPKKPQSELSREFSQGRDKRKLVGKLPMRPELAQAADAAEGGAEGEVERRLPEVRPPVRTRSERSSTARMRTRSSRGHGGGPAGGGGGGGGSATPPPVSANPVPPPEGDEERRLPPMPKGSRSARKKRGGRFRLQGRRVDSGPRITELEPEVVELDETGPVEAEPPPPPPPPPARTLPSAGGGGMDDLFGLAMEGGRMRLGGKKDKGSDGDEG